MGVYLTGSDIYHESYGYPEYGTLGLARTNGLCHEKFSCVITEFGTVGNTDETKFGTKYPTTGFSAVYVLAHEIGHTFGMRHDGFSNDCSDGDFIMSTARSTDDGATKWSQCSAEKMAHFSKTGKTCLDDKPGLDREAFQHERFRGRPGMYFDADAQCKLFLMDMFATRAEADAIEEGGICMTLKCAHSDGSSVVRQTMDSDIIEDLDVMPEIAFSAGPALDGTECSADGFCLGGECVHSNKWYGSRPVSEYYGECRSGCLKRSMGVRKRVMVYDRVKFRSGKWCQISILFLQHVQYRIVPSLRSN